MVWREAGECPAAHACADWRWAGWDNGSGCLRSGCTDESVGNGSAERRTGAERGSLRAWGRARGRYKTERWKRPDGEFRPANGSIMGNAVYRRRRPITESTACAKGRGHHGAWARCGETRAHSCMRERSRKTARNAGEQANLRLNPLFCLSRAKLCAALGNGQITSRAQWGGNGDDPALRPAHLQTTLYARWGNCITG